MKKMKLNPKIVDRMLRVYAPQPDPSPVLCEASKNGHGCDLAAGHPGLHYERDPYYWWGQL